MRIRPLSPSRGFTVIEFAVVLAVIGILAAAVTATLFRARARANEASAVSAMRAINVAQLAYLAGCGNGGYATTLTNLVSVPGGGARGQGYLPAEFAGGEPVQHQGYRISLGRGTGANPGPQPDCSGRATQTSYYASAVPVAPGQTGHLSYATNDRSTIYQLEGTTPPAEPFGPPAVATP